MMRAAFSLIHRAAAVALRGWLIAGILLRVTRLRDGFDPLAVVFYSTPWPAMAAGFLALAIRSRLLRQGHAFRRYVGFTGGALFTWIATSGYWETPAPARAPDLRLVHWNVARPDWLLPSVTARLRAQNADILCIAEAEPEKVRTLIRWGRELPEYFIQPCAGEMVLLVRGEVISSASGVLTPGSLYALHRLRVRGRTVNVMQVDLEAGPLRSRRAAMERLAALVATQADGNLILAGDFNLPRESVHFDPIRRGFRQCFEAAGHGLAETWPVAAPALSLDQVWAGRAWQPLAARHGWSPMSDHRMVVVDLAEP